MWEDYRGATLHTPGEGGSSKYTASFANELNDQARTIGEQGLLQLLILVNLAAVEDEVSNDKYSAEPTVRLTTWVCSLQSGTLHRWAGALLKVVMKRHAC